MDISQIEDDCKSIGGLKKEIKQNIQSIIVPEFAGMVNSVAKVVSDLVLKIGVSHPEYTITLIDHIKGIGQTHMPEICMAWLMVSDSRSAVF